MDKKTHTPRETFVYRAYHKHFHPDKFIGHRASALVEQCASLVNQYYAEYLPNTCEFIIETGLQLKSILASE